MNAGNPSEASCSVAVIGCGCGGTSAALALAKAGIDAIIIEPTPMIGGQLTAQAVPPDEHAWIEGNGPYAPQGFHAANASYINLRSRIRHWYRKHANLTPTATADPLLNPGNGWVSRLCFEPRIAESILRDMLNQAGARFVNLTQAAQTQGVRIITSCTLLSADTDRDTIRAVRVRDNDAHETTIHADVFLDATELGDLIAAANAEHALGAESQSVYNELHARTDLPPGATIDRRDQQACTWCFALEHHPGQDHTIDQPPNYNTWRTLIPDMQPPWTGPLFSWLVPSHNDAGRITLPLIPAPDEPPNDTLELWRYRRIVDRSNHTDARPDVSLFNVVQMDQFLEPLIDDRDAPSIGGHPRALALAREQSLCFLHWMQTEAPRHDDKPAGYPGLKLNTTTLGTTDGFAHAVYVREPRRLIAQHMLTEAHIGFDQRLAERKFDPATHPLGIAEHFDDPIAVGHYPIDLHPTAAGRNNVYVRACPFSVPMSALVPQRITNLLAAGKSLGVSHIANGCTRLHPVEWNIGEAAAHAAALHIKDNIPFTHMTDKHRAYTHLRDSLHSAGACLRWPWEHKQ